jgi:hypothetical protein
VCWINNTRVLPSVSLDNSSGKELVRWGSIDVNQFIKDYERSTVSLSMHFNHPWTRLSYRIRMPMFWASWLTQSYIYIQHGARPKWMEQWRLFGACPEEVLVFQPNYKSQPTQERVWVSRRLSF